MSHLDYLLLTLITWSVVTWSCHKNPWKYGIFQTTKQISSSQLAQQHKSGLKRMKPVDILSDCLWHWSVSIDDKGWIIWKCYSHFLHIVRPLYSPICRICLTFARVFRIQIQIQETERNNVIHVAYMEQYGAYQKKETLSASNKILWILL